MHSFVTISHMYLDWSSKLHYTYYCFYSSLDREMGQTYQAIQSQHSGNINPMFRLYKCASTKIKVNVAVKIQNKIFSLLNERFETSNIVIRLIYIYPIIHFHHYLKWLKEQLQLQYSVLSPNQLPFFHFTVSLGLVLTHSI